MQIKDAMFMHRATGGLYTVVARVTASLPGKERLRNNAPAGIRDTDFGPIAVQMPTVMLRCEATVQGEIENGDQCVLYRGTNSRLWLRTLAEFTDGRFEPMNAYAVAMMPQSLY